MKCNRTSSRWICIFFQIFSGFELWSLGSFTSSLIVGVTTLPETTIAPENRPSQKEIVFQPSIFRCELLVLG